MVPPSPAGPSPPTPTPGDRVTTLVPEHYWKFRPSADTSYCLAVCMDAAGSGCQPSGYDTTQQRMLIMQAGCSATQPGDGSQLW